MCCRLSGLLLVAPLILGACSGGDSSPTVDGDGCGACADGPDAATPTDAAVDSVPECMLGLDNLVACYFAGMLDRTALLARLLDMPPAPPPAALPAELSASLVLAPGDAPVVVSGEVRVLPGVALVLLPGVRLSLAEGANLVVEGNLLVLGTSDAPVHMTGSDADSYGAITLTGGPNEIGGAVVAHGDKLLVVTGIGDSPTRVLDSSFDRWTSMAISFADADGLTIRGCRFGMETALDETSGETINGVTSGLLIEGCEFGHRLGYSDVLDLTDCSVEHAPRILHNVFHGGEDDAIDLDYCSAIVVGNIIRDFRPSDITAFYKGVNGGGITGGGKGQQILLNNVIENCYHGIGFKDGARPILINNTIINCNVGVSLYKSTISSPAPHGVLVNNIVWNNADWTTGQGTDIVLNGKWWPGYNQEDDVQATLDASYNLLADGYEGAGNLSGDPLFVAGADLPLLQAASPAVDTGLGVGFDTGAFPVELVLDYLATDLRGHARTQTEDGFTGIDRGALECW